MYFTLFFISFISSFANKNYNNWTFGEGAWIYFNNLYSDPYFVDKCAINQEEGSSAYSDSQGNLLFYSDGMIVWNNQHTPIINGTNLKGSWTSSQGCYIFPVPNEENKLYIISLGSTENPSEHIYYSVIDYSNGYDNAIVTSKNNKIANYNGERAAIVRKPLNSNGFWMILDDVNKPSYSVYSIDSNGIKPWSIYTGKLNKSDNHGDLKISLNSNLLSSVDSDNSSFEICRFNPYKGEIYDSKVIKVDSIGKTIASSEFSGNSKLMYLTSNERINGQYYTMINQFEVHKFLTDDIVTFHNIIRKPFNWRYYSKETIQIGPNEKLYIASNKSSFLSSIESPNEIYPDCKYVEKSVDLKSRKSKLGLPSMIVEPEINYLFKDTLLCINSELVVDFSENSDSFWVLPNNEKINNGKLLIESLEENDSGYYHFYNSDGDLALILKVNLKLISDDLVFFIDPSNRICEGNKVTIQTKENIESIIWSDGSKNKTREIMNEGTYHYEVFLLNGCSFVDSIEVKFKELSPKIILSRFKCKNNSLVLETVDNYKSYLWSNDETSSSIVVNKQDHYSVRVESFDGCVGFDTIYVSFDSLDIEVDLIPDTLSFCRLNESYYSIENNKRFVDFRWSNGTIGERIFFKSFGVYYLEATDSLGCRIYDTCYVEQINNIKFDFNSLQLDYCYDDSAFVEVINQPNIMYQWSDNFKGGTRYFTQPGSYRLLAIDTLNGCSADTTLDISRYEKVIAQIDKDKNIDSCSSNSISIYSKYKKNTYKYFWNNQQGADYLDITEPGLYTLIIQDTTTGCSDTSSIYVNLLPPILVFSTLETKMCLDDSAYVELEEIPNVVFEWYDGGNELKRYFNKIGSYSLTAIDTLNGCRLDTVINLSYYPNVISKIDYDAGSEKCESEPKLLESRYKNPNYKYIWNNIDGTDSYLAEESGRYTLIVLDTITGCSDTSFIEIEISDPIQASILGSDICYGGSTVLLADPNNTDYEYIWSTGENTSSITVTNSGEYFVIVSNGDCLDTAYFNVEYLENPNVEIIGESMICKNESATLSSNSNFNSYLWSTGDTTKTIDINSPGTYKLTVTNEFGCIDSTEFVVKEYVIDYELSSKHIDFGKTYLDDSMQESLIIKNLSQFNIRLSNEEYGNIEIGSNDEIELNIDFYATTLGEYLDTLEFEILSPCKSAFYVLVTAEVYTIATISSDHIKTRIGTDIEVPFYISGADKIGQLNLDVETNISNKLFSPDKSLDFNANVLVNPVKQNIYNMKGKTLLSDIIITPIEYINVNSDNRFVEFNLIPGSIEVDSICVFNFRNITLVSDFETTFLVDNEELNIKIEQPTSDESSEYYLELISIDGKKMIDKKIISRNSLIETKMSTSNISSGVYILRVSNMYEVITRKVLITK